MRKSIKTPAKEATKARCDTTTQQPKHTDKHRACKCPRCNFTASQALFVPGWLDDLRMRVTRYWSMGFGPDVAAMSLIELHALWRWLLRQGG